MMLRMLRYIREWPCLIRPAAGAGVGLDMTMTGAQGEEAALTGMRTGADMEASGIQHFLHTVLCMALVLLPLEPFIFESGHGI